MDGDDAVEFFDEFARTFTVDITLLGEDWHAYFAAEGMPLGTTLLVVVPGALIGIVLSRSFPFLPGWAWFLVGFVAWMFLFARWIHWRNKTSPQITMQDLVDSARAGKWTKTPPRPVQQDDRRSLFRADSAH